MKNFFTASFMVLSLGLALPVFSVVESSPKKDALVIKNSLPYREGRLLVKIKENNSGMTLNRVIRELGARPTSSYTLIKGLYVYEFNENIDLEDAKDAFMESGVVEYAEPDYYYYAALIPNDPRFSELWGMENTGQTGGSNDADINASSMWDISTGDDEVVIGIIDTGIDYNHPDLISNLWSNPREIAGNNIDDDQNGYVDDVHGINAISNNGNPFDDNKHGTHVAGTIGARGNNLVGVVGVNHKVKIASCKFLSARGSGSISDAIECMEYFAKLKSRTNNPLNLVATNNSWGGGSRSQAMFDAIKAHESLGILFIAAAGNSSTNNDVVSSFPANYELSNVISVAATDHNDRLASFSSYGQKSVHLAAPGVKILSTVPNNGYAELSGTSMATPHVTGMAAMIKSRFPEYNYLKIKNLLISSGTPIAAAQGKTISGRRLRGADTNGQGALTCNDQKTTMRMLPKLTTYNLNLGETVLLSAININCHEPAGELTVFQSPTTNITLKDNGENGDEIAGDGVYTLLWQPSEAGTYPLDFGNNDIITMTIAGETSGLKSYKVNKVGFEYQQIQGTRLNVKDESLHTIISPFPIRFGNSPAGFTEVSISSNGTISFTDRKNPGYQNLSLPNPAQETLIALYWDDLTKSSYADSDIYVETIGSSPNRQLIIEYWKMRNYNTNGIGTFQTVFYENSSDIRMNYLDTNFNSTSYSYGKSATVGVQISSTSAKLFSFNTSALPSSSSLLFQVDQ